VADDEDDDAVRTSVSEDRVAVNCVLRIFSQHSVYVALSVHQKSQP
jgi:hypothetical protein